MDERRDALGALGALDELLALTAGLLPEPTRRHLQAARARVAGDRFNLVVLGEFKRGKSTLINGLLGRELLPTGVVPLTSVVTVIGTGKRECLVIAFQDGREQELPVAQLAEYVTEARNPNNARGVEMARIELDHELLRGGLELVDTPGIGSIHAHNTEVARSFLPRVDAALCVLDAGQPLSAGERELFIDAARRVPILLMVINKIDHLDAADRVAATQFVRSALSDLLEETQWELFAVSARTGEGLAALAASLRRLALEERQALLLRSVGGLAAGVAVDGAQAARFEAHAIELPLDELTARAQQFEQRIADLRLAAAEAGDLLDRGIARALAELVNRPLQEHARREQDRLRIALRGRAQELGPLSPRALSIALEECVQATVRSEFERLVVSSEAAIAAELTELERRYAQRVERILVQVQETAEDVFGLRAGDMLPQTGLQDPSRFSFKLDDVQGTLDILVGFSRTITPGALGRRLVINDAEQRLIEMTDRHAGRLRSELAGRVSAAGRDYRRQLSAVTADAIDTIRAAIGRAMADRRRGEQRSRARRDELVQIERRCRRLATTLDPNLGNGPRSLVGERA